jgi:hypothetical protein
MLNCVRKIFWAALYSTAPIFLGYLIMMPPEYAVDIAWGHLKTFGMYQTVLYFAMFFCMVE